MKDYIKKLIKKKEGFTLLEMLVVIFIIGLLILLVIPNLNKQRDAAQQKADAAIIQVVETQKELYKLDHPEDKAEITPAKLKDNAYLTEDQLKAYTNAAAHQ